LSKSPKTILRGIFSPEKRSANKVRNHWELVFGSVHNSIPSSSLNFLLKCQDKVRFAVMSRHSIWSMFCLSKNRLKPIVDYAMSRWSMIWYAAVYGQPIMLQRDKMMMLHQNLGIFKDPLPQHGPVASTNPYASSPQ